MTAENERRESFLKRQLHGIPPASLTKGISPPERVELRVDDEGVLDDVVVRDVTMFRLERMDKNLWWGCCYLDAGADERVDFWFRSSRKDGLTVWSEDQ